jgi:hypothetical protein
VSNKRAGLLKGIFRATKEDVMGGWKRLHIGEQYQIKLRWERYVASVEAMKNIRKILDGNSKGNIQLGRHRGKWEDNIKLNIWKGKAS